MSCRQQLLAAGERDDAFETRQFQSHHPFSESSYPVIATPLVVTIRRLAAPFFNPACVEHSLDRAVECAPVPADLPLGHFFDLARDGVAVLSLRLVGEGEENVKDDGSEREL